MVHWLKKLVHWLKKWFTLFFGIPILLMALWKPWDSIWIIVLSSAISIIAFFLTASVVTRWITEDRLEKVQNEIPGIKQDISLLKSIGYEKEKEQEERRLLRYYIAKFRFKKSLTSLTENEKTLSKLLAEGVPENQESPAVILGMGGLYAIVNGLGITEALTKYADSLGTNITDLLPYSLRLVTFLATIIPFIHGFILTFSNRWYYDAESDTTHYEWAFAFFIVVFFQTVLLFFAAVNVQQFGLFFFMLWSLMVFNTPWLCVQIYYILKDKINIVNVFPKQWIILNFNTAAFLSILVFGGDQLHTAAQNDVLINALIFFVLLCRSIADYMVGWKDLYNRPPDPRNP